MKVAEDKVRVREREEAEMRMEEEAQEKGQAACWLLYANHANQRNRCHLCLITDGGPRCHGQQLSLPLCSQSCMSPGLKGTRKRDEHCHGV